MRLTLLFFFLSLGWMWDAHAAGIDSQNYAAIGTSTGGNALLTNSPVQIGPIGQRNITSYNFYNSNNTVEYVQLFNGTSTSVALGTSVPQMVIPLGSSSVTALALPDSAAVTFFNGLAAAATTTPTGSSAPSTGISGVIGYQ
jgi:hypothetical protein